ncbi:hypothetical protein QOT17_012496, partial [Balamuthia mandrillaris]
MIQCIEDEGVREVRVHYTSLLSSLPSTQSMPRLLKTWPALSIKLSPISVSLRSFSQTTDSTEFINVVVKALKMLSGFEHQFISAYHPQ